mmetsp:Transcript_106752/g.166738  ORF Transcript_106752/g.166738 Transcript_106752/m.166738 type:complete len:316 (-) Transcript_106752:22-969(-)
MLVCDRASSAQPAAMACEEALSRPSCLSKALSEMLADPNWHRGRHAMLKSPVDDVFVRRVEYTATKQRRRDPSPQTSALVAVRLPSCGASSSSSASFAVNVEAGLLDLVERSPSPPERPARIVVRRGVANAEQAKANTAPLTGSTPSTKPPRPGTGTSNRLPVASRQLRSYRSLDYPSSDGVTEEDKDRRYRRASLSSEPGAREDAVEAPSRRAARCSNQARPQNAGLQSLRRASSARPPSRSASADRCVFGEGRSGWVTEGTRSRPTSAARSRCRIPSKSGRTDEERVVPTIRALPVNASRISDSDTSCALSVS